MGDGKTLIHGTAAEHLVCADLLMLGHRAFLASQICPYDVVAEIGGQLLKIQVKSVRGIRATAGHPRQKSSVYQWSIRKRNRATYASDDWDVVAMVALDTKRIAYMSRAALGASGCVVIRANDEKIGGRGQVGKVFSEFTLTIALNGSRLIS